MIDEILFEPINAPDIDELVKPPMPRGGRPITFTVNLNETEVFERRVKGECESQFANIDPNVLRELIKREWEIIRRRLVAGS